MFSAIEILERRFLLVVGFHAFSQCMFNLNVTNIHEAVSFWSLIDFHALELSRSDSEALVAQLLIRPSN